MPDDWLLFNTKGVLGGALAGQKNPGAPGRSSSKAAGGVSGNVSWQVAEVVRLQVS